MENTETIKVPIGGLWECSEWEVQKDVKVHIGYREDLAMPWRANTRFVTLCPHMKTLHVEKIKNFSDDSVEMEYVTVPFVAVFSANVGFDTVGVCLQCILDYVDGNDLIPNRIAGFEMGKEV